MKTVKMVLVAALLSTSGIAFAKTQEKRKPANIRPQSANYVLVEASDEQTENCQAVISLEPNSMRGTDLLRALYPSAIRIVNASKGSGSDYRYIVHSKDLPGKLVIDISFVDETEFTWNESVAGNPNYKGELCRNARYQGKGRTN